MARYTLVAASVYGVGLLSSLASPGTIFGVLEDLGILALTVSAVYYAGRLFRWLRRKVFWKVRNKIIVSYAFVGFIPLIILAAVAWVALLLIFKQLSALYLQNELETIADVLDSTNRRIAISYYQDRAEDRSSLPFLLQAVRENLRTLPTGFKSSVVEVFHQVQTSDSTAGSYSLVARLSADGELDSRAEICPPWVRDGLADFVVRKQEIQFVSALNVDKAYLLVLGIPFNDRMIEYFLRRTSIEMEIPDSSPSENASEFEVTFTNFYERQDFTSIPWAHFFRAVEWESGDAVSRVILLSVPMWVLLNNFFAETAAPTLILLIVLLAVAFILVEAFSLFVGIALARSITGSIHNIYSAVQSIRDGNFDFRVSSRGRDQLDAVADSFNEMSTSVVELMGEVSKREALEKELEIAKEVQTQLFPQLIPSISGLEIAVSCTPARRVSGDYYDLLSRDGNHLDLVVGDISGKGISAALLMASIQSTIQSGLSAVESKRESERMVTVVRGVNRQLYRRTTPESYSTLVLSHFDTEERVLSYCNAGHHPPLVFSNGEVTPLTVGGTVVGLFENWNYEGTQISFTPGDVLLYFTDGVVEAENEDDEQFGSDRLIELVQGNTFLTADDIHSLVMDSVFQWSAGREQADDITVVCVKIVD
jgi:sigma-B regulation protein RsbU (phosphoserine phosphatase)